VIPTSAAPITFFLRESAEWLSSALAAKSVDEAVLTQSLSPQAQRVRALLAERGAAFTADLQRLTGLTRLETATALWELATAGLASADGFDQLRAMMDPRRKSVAVAQTPAVSLRKRAAARTTAGRWSLLCDREAATPAHATSSAQGPLASPSVADASESRHAHLIAKARRADAALDAHARILLCRYGVLFRELLEREANAPKWRDLAPILRRLEARGEIRGGRFVSGAFGEQFALPEAVDALRTARREAAARSGEAPIEVAAADPLNLVGILIPGERAPSIPGRVVRFVNGAAMGDESAAAALSATPRGATPRPATPRHSRSIADIVRAEALPQRLSTESAASSPRLFS
jgi:ATP-dependent Lhr-like helicase